MSTQTSTTTSNESQRSKIIAETFFLLADNKVAPSKKLPDYDRKTFFPLSAVGLSTPPLFLPTILLALSYYQEIPAWDRFFTIAFPLYLCLANKIRFDNNAKQFAARKARGQPYPEKPEWFGERGPWFAKYMIFAATIGVLLPLLVHLLAPSPIANATAPHVFLLLSQILMEIMVNGPRFHPMLQVINPIGYSVYRLGSLKMWVVLAWEMLSTTANNDGIGSNAILTWEMMHFWLAVTNVLFWTYNTFVLLLLRVVPPCLDQNKFPDANVSWKYQLIPTVNGSEPLGKKLKN
jgi:hypothetical protein